MEVHIPAELVEKIDRMAMQQGRNSESLVAEALARYVAYDEWFLREAAKGIEAADRGALIDHAEIRRRIERRYPA